MFPAVEYVEWITGRPEVAPHDLASSDLRGDREFESAAVLPALADLPDPPTGVNVETLVATEYGVDPEQVLVTAGATQANAIAAAAAMEGEPDDEGDTVLVEKPSYEPLVRTPQGLGANVNRFVRGDDHALDPERAANALTDETRLVTVTNRHNPSGRLANPDALAEVARAAADTGARLLVDEVYAPYVTEPVEGEASAFGGPTAAGIDNTVVTGSLTKFHGLGDIRVGWLIADREFVKRARQVYHHLPSVAGTSRAQAARALYAEDLEVTQRELLAANADLLAEFVDARNDVVGEVSAGSTFAFLGHESADGDAVAAAAEDEGVLVVPGRFFEDAERVRVSLGRTPREMDAALRALAVALDRVEG
jgi:aspartate/methionine/tyrosine aminotransferase